MNQKYMKMLAIVIGFICLVGIAVSLLLDDDKAEVRVSNVADNTSYSDDKNAEHSLLVITNDGKYGFATLEGTVVETPSYDMISTANYGLYYIKSGTTQGFVNSNRKIVFTTEETIASNVSEGFVIYKRNGKSGFINIKDGTKIEAVYDFVYDFSEGLAAVQKDGKIGFINTKGDLIIPHIYYEKGLHKFNNGLCAVMEVDETGKTSAYYIDKAGNRVFNEVFDYGMTFYDGLAFVKQGEMWHIIDETGTTASPKRFGPYSNTVPGKFSEGYASVIENGYYGIINKSCEYVISPSYEMISDVSGGRVVFKKNGKFGYMNVDGSVIIAPYYEFLGNFKNGMAIYSEQNKYGVLREDGSRILNPEYKKIEILDNSVLKVYTDDKTYFYADSTGKKIWQ